jgi:hypothetical protein
MGLDLQQHRVDGSQKLRRNRLCHVLLGLLLLWSLATRLLFSWPDPTLNRFWDERYNAGNVAAVLALDRWQPIRAHYPTLSYVPHTATLKIYEAARGLRSLSSAPPSFGVRADGRPFLTRTGLRICRTIQTLVGVSSLLVVFLIGRRLFGAWVGLGATFLLAVAPWHLRLSALFKPDIMLVLTATLAVYAMLRARHRDSLGGYAIAGALVGACAASKWNGAALVLPLLVTIVLGGIDRRWLFLRRCLAAGGAGAAVLLALNPWLILTPDVYRRHLGSTMNQYEERLVNSSAGLLDQPLNAATSLLGGIYFGPVLGSCALLGLGSMLVVAIRRRAGSGLPGTRGIATVSDAWILLTCFGGYVGALWAVTRYPKPPNWLIIAPVAALAGAWFTGWLFEAILKARAGRYRGPAVIGLAAVLGVAAWPKIHFVQETVYDENVPRTAVEAARETGADKPLRGRTFFSELPLGNEDFDPRVWDGNHVPTLVLTESIAAEPRLERESADALLFPASRLETDHDETYRELASSGGGATVQRFEPDLFRLRGDAVVLVRQHFGRLGPPEPHPFHAAGEGVYEVTLADSGGAETTESVSDLLSIEVAVRTPSRDAVSVQVEADGDLVQCRTTRKGRDRRRCLTPRLRAPLSRVRVLIQPARDVIDVSVFRWRRPT